MTQLQALSPFDTAWPFHLVAASQDKAVPRAVVQEPYAHEMVGVDGSLTAGLRPFAGFQLEYELDFQHNPYHDSSSVVNFIESVTFAIGADGYGMGFVYRARRSAHQGLSGVADVFVDFWNSKVDHHQQFGRRGVRVAKAVSATAPMAVVVFGMFVYVFVQGRDVAMFYIDETELTAASSSTSSGCRMEGAPGTASYTIKKFGEECGDSLPGPGKQPILTSPELADPLGTLILPSPHSGNRPGVGQICFTTQDPSSHPLYPDLAESSSGGGVGNSGKTGRLLDAGGYTFAYQLLDSKTGRKSAISQVAQCRDDDFLVTQSTSSGSDTTSPDKYIVLELIYDSYKYDQVVVYRSQRVEDAGSILNSAYMHIDDIIDLEEHWTLNNGSAAFQWISPWRHAIYYYKYEDKQLNFHPIYQGSTFADETMPKGGAATWYDGALIVSAIRGRGGSTEDAIRVGDAQNGLGEIRYSDLQEVLPENFNPYFRLIPKTPGNTPICYREAAPNMIGFSGDRVYHLRKENIFIRSHEMHEGYGITGPRAADSVGSMVYYMTKAGLATVDATGELDETRALDDLVQQRWAGTLGEVSLAFDPHAQALFVHNPTLEETVVLWFRTSRVTELHDMVFSTAFRGQWPSTHGNYGSTLEGRALFLQNSPTSGLLQDWKPRIYRADYHRERLDPVASVSDVPLPVVRLLDVRGNSRFTTTAAITTTTVSVSLASAEELDTRLEGAYLYVMDCSDAAYIGKKIKIKRRVSASTFELAASPTADDVLNLPSGSRVGISPVYFRWVGSHLDSRSDDGTKLASTVDYMGDKQLDTIGCVIVDCAGTPAVDGLKDNRWRGLAYKGSSTSIYSSAFPLGTDDSKYASVEDGPSRHWAAFGAVDEYQRRNGVAANILTPGIEVVCPDMDFRLLSAMCKGKILPSLARVRTTTNQS